jgi:MFS family permease
VGIVGTLVALRFVPNLKPVGGQRFDYWGAVTLFISLLCLLLALTLGQGWGFADGRILFLFAVSLLLAVVFILIESRAEQPMIDLRLFRNRLFSVNLVTGFITFFAIAGAFILMPFYLENVLGYNVRQVGFLLAVIPIALGVSAPISGALSDRFGTRPISVIGLAVLLIAYYGLSTLTLEVSTIGFVLRFLPIGLGMGIFQSPNNSAIMGSAPRDQLGVASGLLSITRSLGQTAGIAALGALWAGRVFAYTGRPLAGGATTAPAVMQVAALHDTFLIITVLIVLALLLGLWGLAQERREQTVAAVKVEAPSKQRVL